MFSPCVLLILWFCVSLCEAVRVRTYSTCLHLHNTIHEVSNAADRLMLCGCWYLWCCYLSLCILPVRCVFPYDMYQKRLQKGLVKPQARHMGNVSTSPKQGEQARVTRAASQAIERTHMHECTWQNTWYQWLRLDWCRLSSLVEYTHHMDSHVTRIVYYGHGETELPVPVASNNQYETIDINRMYVYHKIKLN